MRKRRLLIGFVGSLLLAVLLSACGGGRETLVLSFDGLEPLANGYHYEGWAIIDGSPVTTGKFNVDGAGNLVDLGGGRLSGEFETGRDLSDASAIVLTIEPAGDTDTVPADTHVLAGSVDDNEARLTTGHGAALGDAFGGATGSYILATPTDGDGNNETGGIWFIELPPSQGLQLPELAAGWAYEGWAVIGSQPVTTGRFTSVDVADMDAPFSGTMAGPPFPGEDFLMNAPSGLTFPTDLAGGLAVISIEPEPDDSPAPYTLKPLLGGIDGTAVDHVTYSIANMAGATFPTGTALIR